MQCVSIALSRGDEQQSLSYTCLYIYFFNCLFRNLQSLSSFTDGFMERLTGTKLSYYLNKIWRMACFLCARVQIILEISHCVSGKHYSKWNRQWFWTVRLLCLKSGLLSPRHFSGWNDVIWILVQNLEFLTWKKKPVNFFAKHRLWNTSMSERTVWFFLKQVLILLHYNIFVF